MNGYTESIGVSVSESSRKPTDKGRYAIKVDIKVPVKDLRSEMSRYGFNGKSFKMYERHHETCGLFLSFEKQKG